MPEEGKHVKTGLRVAQALLDGGRDLAKSHHTPSNYARYRSASTSLSCSPAGPPVPDQQLIHSGFSRDDTWGFRSCEPSRNIISSMALVLLKTGIIHPGAEGSTPGQDAPTIDLTQMATAQKLLLFWRKPAVS